MMKFEIETDRLVMREWHMSEWTALLPIASGSDVMRFIADGSAWTQERVRAFVSCQIENVGLHGFCLGAMCCKETGEVIGLGGLQRLGYTGEIEIGWWLAKNFWGRGLATEAGRGLLRFAFERAGLQRVVAIAHPENHASIAVMKKLGMYFEKRMRRGDLGFSHPDIEIVMYSIERTDI